MGQLISEGSSSEEGERALMSNFISILQVSIEIYVQREAIQEVPESVLWSALGMSPVVDRLMSHLPCLLARTFSALQNSWEEINRENKYQQILWKYEENT